MGAQESLSASLSPGQAQLGHMPGRLCKDLRNLCSDLSVAPSHLLRDVHPESYRRSKGITCSQLHILSGAQQVPISKDEGMQKH